MINNKTFERTTIYKNYVEKKYKKLESIQETSQKGNE